MEDSEVAANLRLRCSDVKLKYATIVKVSRLELSGGFTDSTWLMFVPASLSHAPEGRSYR